MEEISAIFQKHTAIHNSGACTIRTGNHKTTAVIGELSHVTTVRSRSDANAATALASFSSSTIFAYLSPT